MALNATHNYELHSAPVSEYETCLVFVQGR